MEFLSQSGSRKDAIKPAMSEGLKLTNIDGHKGAAVEV
jgi:hypothetical protein